MGFGYFNFARRRFSVNLIAHTEIGHLAVFRRSDHWVAVCRICIRTTQPMDFCLDFNSRIDKGSRLIDPPTQLKHPISGNAKLFSIQTDAFAPKQISFTQNESPSKNPTIQIQRNSEMTFSRQQPFTSSQSDLNSKRNCCSSNYRECVTTSRRKKQQRCECNATLFDAKTLSKRLRWRWLRQITINKLKIADSRQLVITRPTCNA